MFGLNKKYRDDVNEIDEDDDGAQFVPPQKLGWPDVLVAAALGLFAAVLVHVLSYKGLHPDAWSECVLAAGVRTPEAILPGFWIPCAKTVLSAFGLSKGLVVLVLLGRVLLGVAVALAYLFFKTLLSIVIRMVETKNRIWWPVLSRAVCAFAAVLFLCADPVWSLGAYFSPALFESLHILLVAFLFALFLCHGTLAPLYWAMFLTGLLCAETPAGYLILALFWTTYYIQRNHGRIAHVLLLDAHYQQRSKWYLTFFWGGGLLLGVAANIASFKASGGMDLLELTAAGMPLKYIGALWEIFTGAASAGAWIIGVIGVSLACLLAVMMMRRAADLEYFLSYHIGVLYFFVGCLAYSQISSLHPLWFWRFGDVFTVSSKPLLFCCALAVIVALLCALAILTIDVFCRDNQRLAGRYDVEDDNSPDRHRPYGLFAIVGTVAVAALLLAGVLPGRVQPKTLEALGLIDDYVRETVTECGDADFLFSDGQYDCALELESARRGGHLKCIAVQPAAYARRGKALTDLMTDAEDRTSATIGGANVLRTWQRDKPERLARAAVQVGLEMWRQTTEKDTYPFVSGVAARTVWPDAKGNSPDVPAIARGIAAAKNLSERVLALYAAGGLPGKASASVRDMFLFMQWRLARMSRIRAKVSGFRLDLERSRAESDLADRLDAENEALQRIQAAMARMGELMMHQMTPREGLRIALIRGDYPQAHRCAEAILDSSPDDPEAHFGIGMNFLLLGQYNLAEDHLRACFKKRPKDATIWNNLAELRLRQANAMKVASAADEESRQKHCMDALEYCRTALQYSPKSHRSNRTREVLDTMVKIKNALEPNYDPDADPELRVDIPAEMETARASVRELKALLVPNYDPEADAELAAADVAQLAALTKRLLRLTAAADMSAQAAREALEDREQKAGDGEQ